MVPTILSRSASTPIPLARHRTGADQSVGRRHARVGDLHAAGLGGRDAWRETKKVVWPARKEAIQMTAYVFAFVFVMALFLWLTDKTLEWLFYDLILGWRK